MTDDNTPADPHAEPPADPLAGVAVTGLPGLTDEPAPAAGEDPAASAETVADEAIPVVTPEQVAEAIAPAAEPAAELVAEAPAPPAEPEPAAPAPPKKAKKEKAVAAATATAEPAPAADGAAETPPADTTKKWYVVKVQSGREESIKAAVERKVKIEGLEEFYGQIAIPVERVTEVKKVRATDKKTGEKTTQEKRVVKERKKYHGYIFAEVDFNDRILYLFRETSGVGDFVGATHTRAPTPMTDREVQAMLGSLSEKEGGPQRTNAPIKVKIEFEKGDKVRIRDGAFANMEGEVKSITEPKDTTETPKVTVVVSIFGRPVDVELDYWQVDKV